jgi:hypothetical protein
VPRPFRFRIRDENGETPEIAGTFSDDEWNLLVRFAAAADDLANVPLAKRGLDYGFSFAWDGKTGWSPIDSRRFPSRTEPHEFLYVLRSIILESEPTHFLRVLYVLSRKAPHSGWRSLRARFDGSRFLEMLRIELHVSVGDQNAIVLNSERTLKNWLNALRSPNQPAMSPRVPPASA